MVTGGFDNIQIHSMLIFHEGESKTMWSIMTISQVQRFGAGRWVLVEMDGWGVEWVLRIRALKMGLQIL